jgi:hypothetical protein
MTRLQLLLVQLGGSANCVALMTALVLGVQVVKGALQRHTASSCTEQVLAHCLVCGCSIMSLLGSKIG